MTLRPRLPNNKTYAWDKNKRHGKTPEIHEREQSRSEQPYTGMCKAYGARGRDCKAQRQMTKRGYSNRRIQ